MNIETLGKELAYMIYYGGILPENFDRKFLFQGKILRVKCANGCVVYCQNLKTKKVYFDAKNQAAAV